MLVVPLLALLPLQQFHCTEDPLPTSAFHPISAQAGASLSGDLAVFGGAPPAFPIQELVTYERGANGWEYRSTLHAAQSPSTFGGDQDLEGTSLLVAERGYVAPSGQMRGRILAYEWDSAAGLWITGESILAPFGGPRRFGNSFARDGEWLAAYIESAHPQVGLPLMLYRRDAAGNWQHHQTIHAAAPGFSGFRGALELHGSTLLAEDTSGLRVFRLGAGGTWTEDGPLTAFNGNLGSVRVLEDEILVGAVVGVQFSSPGRILRFVRDAATGAWPLVQEFDSTLFPPGTHHWDMVNFDASEELLLVGQGSFGPTRAGRLLRFERNPSTGAWVPADALDRGAGQVDYERLGTRVVLDGTRALVMSASQLLTSHSAYMAELSTVDCNANMIDDSCELLQPENDRNGDGVLDLCQLVGSVYCAPANNNSTGAASRIGALGSELLADEHLDVVVDRLPPGEFGYLLASSAPGFLANVGGSSGNLCLGGGPTFGRYTDQIGNSGSAGLVFVRIDVPVVTTAVGPQTLLAGDTWYFQYWNRDGATSNHSPGLEVLFQ